MRIAINTRFLLKDKIEGIGRVTYELARRLVLNHPEHDFIFLFDRPCDEAFIFADNITPVIIPPPARHPFLWFAWFEFAVPRALKKYKADVFLSPDGYCSLSTKVRQVMITHDLAHVHYPNEIPFLVRKYYDFFVPRFLKKADQIISVSDATKLDIVASYRIDPDKITTVHNGNRDGFYPLSIAEQEKIRTKYTSGDPYFLYVGAVHPRKNLDRLIYAFDLFKAVSKNNVKLLIGGRLAWQTDKVKNAYEQADAKDDIEFLGFIPEEELPKLMASALGFVYVSLFEGFGLPILEAMHCEVPVITSETSSMPEVAGDAAILVDPLSAGDITAAMQSLYEDPALRNRLIEAGKIQRQKFDWDKAARGIEYRILS